MTTGGTEPTGTGQPAAGSPRGAGDEGSDTAALAGPGSEAAAPVGVPPMAPGQVPGAPVAPRDPAPPQDPTPPYVAQPPREPQRAAAHAAGTATATATRPVTVGSVPRKGGGRRARLTVKRIDPWSTLKFSFVYSLAGLVVLLVAVIALYAIVDAMGVIDSIRSFLHDVEGENSSNGIASWLGFGRVITVALVVGGVNVILFTAFATLTAFVYNVCTDLVGGIEVTLADRT